MASRSSQALVARQSSRHALSLIVRMGIQRNSLRGKLPVAKDIESNLVEGAQKIVDGKATVYGQSVTDACIWEETESTLDGIARAVNKKSMCV